ncbi:cytidine monophosphate (UMP-CMP) kinase 1, cytosolic [Myotisia sp. PD_48]|nr:cytidine monophosphate (UMP-CMP) kinase 1, cytosolic [Myotisia sp. PD_48]
MGLNPTSKNRPTIICVLGPPAVGKGTICRRLAEEFGLFHFSLGDYLRTLSKDEQCPVREDIIELFRRGGLFPIDFLAPLVKAKLRLEYEKGYSAILLDGFPRSMEQLRGYGDSQDFDLAVFCDCPKAMVKMRYINRKLPGRLEDDEALFNARYREYEELNPAVIDYFRNEDMLIQHGEARRVEENDMFKRLAVPNIKHFTLQYSPHNIEDPLHTKIATRLGFLRQKYDHLLSQKEYGTLWQHYRAGSPFGSKAVVRTTCQNRSRAAFRQALRAHGFHRDGKPIVEETDQPKEGLRGTLYITLLCKVTLVPFEDLVLELGHIVKYLEKTRPYRDSTTIATRSTEMPM